VACCFDRRFDLRSVGFCYRKDFQRSLAVAQQVDANHISPQELSFGVATDTNFIVLIFDHHSEVTFWSNGIAGRHFNTISYNKLYSVVVLKFELTKCTEVWLYNLLYQVVH